MKLCILAGKVTKGLKICEGQLRKQSLAESCDRMMGLDAKGFPGLSGWTSNLSPDPSI
jgi:hypothetical protein